MENTNITLTLTKEQAIAFRLLAQAGAWDLRKGSVTLHFNENGVPTSAETRIFTVIPTPIVKVIV